MTYTVTKIDNLAFFSCPKLLRVIMPSTVTAIGNRTFKDSPNLASITIPENVTSIGVYAFDGCTALNEITCLAITPPVISYNTFTESQYQGASLYVPYGCADAYSIASIWELFCDLFELRPDEDAINGIVETLKNDDIYDLSGRKVKKVTVPGIYIKGGKRVMIK